ncbi:dipeptidase [Ectobacillus panaciterrae]|uniref:dipeptidase n=1 Tax=Ectobacillus panaciterrae TaxID=363872 RepID=UPI00040544A1|nr:dipeptidase [Ectobacillus panaciterrae]
MKIFDAHCDVLWQLWRAKQKRFANDSSLHITLEGLKKSNGKIQCFAIYIPEHVPHEHRFHAALEMVEIFYKEIVDKHSEVKLVLTKQDAQRLQEGEIGALLTLEGCDAIGQSITRLDTLHRLGVRSVGLTWNYSNAVADGVLEPRGAGLSSFGIKVVERLNEHSLWTDVSHLSEKGFWDVMEHAEHPIASHSNCHVLREHPRNLKNEQIQALLEKDGMIGITFVPSFVKEQMPVHIKDVLLHLEHICALGGENNVGFGSDFDGITETIVNLECYTHYENLINELQKHYKEEQVRKFLYSNFAEHISF